jgi:hypothetical protein
VTYRAAVVGCGRIGSTLADDPLLAGDVMTHAEAYVVCPDTELVAVVDTDQRRAIRVQRAGKFARTKLWAR